jgi:hypothetical protein
MAIKQHQLIVAIVSAASVCGAALGEGQVTLKGGVEKELFDPRALQGDVFASHSTLEIFQRKLFSGMFSAGGDSGFRAECNRLRGECALERIKVKLAWQKAQLDAVKNDFREKLSAFREVSSAQIADRISRLEVERIRLFGDPQRAVSQSSMDKVVARLHLAQAKFALDREANRSRRDAQLDEVKRRLAELNIIPPALDIPDISDISDVVVRARPLYANSSVAAVLQPFPSPQRSESVTGVLQPSVPAPAQEAILWDPWYSHFERILEPALLRALEEQGSPMGTNTVAVTVSEDHTISVDVIKPAKDSQFNSAVWQAYASLNHNPALQFPPGTERSVIHFFIDHHKSSPDDPSVVISRKITGDIEYHRNR